jgi:carboxyl-terminal processing protease
MNIPGQRRLLLSILLVWTLRAQEAVEEPGSRVQVEEKQSDVLEQMARFTLALEQIHRLYAASEQAVTYEELVDAAIRGMASNLDAYSSYLEDENLEDLQEKTQGSFVGIGVVINRGPRFPRVVSPIEGSPGWEAGLQSGDVLLAIDGKSTEQEPLDQVVKRIKGQPGTDVMLRVRRPAENRTFDLTLTRAQVENPSVDPFRILQEGVGYIRLKTFTENTVRLMRKEMTGLKKKGIERLVLDLRGNPGGLLDAAVEVAGLFLPKNTLVVYTQGVEDGGRTEYRTTTRPHRLEPALVILVNEGSASASELVSGALQDYGRAVLVGETTFGKASVQSILPLPDGTALRLTTAEYFTPKDRAINGKGIEPDVEVGFLFRRWIRLESRGEEEDWRQDPQLLRAVELLTEKDGPDADSGD